MTLRETTVSLTTNVENSNDFLRINAVPHQSHRSFPINGEEYLTAIFVRVYSARGGNYRKRIYQRGGKTK